MDVFVYGASGFAGSRVLEVLAARGLGLVAAGRDESKLAAVVRGMSPRPAVCPIAVRDRDGLARALRGVRVVVNCAGPSLDLGTALIDAAVANGAHYLDISSEVSFLRDVHDRHAASARHSGVVIAPGFGAKGTLGDWGAQRAVATAPDATASAIRVAYAHAARAYLRPSVAAWLAAAGQGFYRPSGPKGPIPVQREFEFPPPFGRGVALMVPGPEDVSIPRGVLGVRTSSFIALAPGHAGNAIWAQWEVHTGKLVPALAKVLLTGWGRMHLRAWFPGPARSHPRDTLAMVIEVDAGLRTSSLAIVARDLYEVTAATVALGVERLLESPAGVCGVLTPSGLLDAGAALRRLDRSGTIRVLSTVT